MQKSLRKQKENLAMAVLFVRDSHLIYGDVILLEESTLYIHVGHNVANK